MATVFRKSVTKRLPDNAEIFTRKGEQFARWKDGKGKSRSAPIIAGRDGSERIVIQASTFTAKYRDGQGIVREVATGCRDETAARSVLAQLQRRAELVKAKVITSDEDATSGHQDTSLVVHFSAFRDHQKAKGMSRRIDDMQSQLKRVAADCGFRRLADLDGAAFERWLAEQQAADMSAATRNEYRATWIGFANWCVKNHRLLSNPFVNVPRGNVKADRRRERRSLTEDELHRLLDVARQRPLLDAMTVRRGKRKGQAVANLRDETRLRLQGVGRERALIYKTLVLTGLRKNELTTLAVGQLDLDMAGPYLSLDSDDEKNRQGNDVALRRDLADDLRQWLADKLQALQDESRRRGEPIPVRLPADALVFYVPSGLLRILNRDLKAAGIPKIDERGRSVDVHAMRHTFGTHLGKGGVAPRTAQAAMRHSKIDLTMNVYTDPKLLDIRGALDALPMLPLHGGPQSERIAASATGTDDSRPLQFAPGFAPTSDKSSKSGSIAGNRDAKREAGRRDRPRVVSADGVKRKHSPTTAVSECSKVGGIGLEPTTSTMSTWRSSQLS